MINNLQQLLDLPELLERTVALEAYQQAVIHYTTAKVVLEKYQHIPSFKSLLSKSTVIMDGLKERLSKDIEDKKISINSLSNKIQLLLQLDYDKVSLRTLYLQFTKNKLMKRLVLFLPVEERPKNLPESSDEEEDPETIRIKEGQCKTMELPLLHFIKELDRFFLESFIEIAYRYKELFPYNNKENEDAINQMTSELFQLYFKAIDNKLQNDVSGSV